MKKYILFNILVCFEMKAMKGRFFVKFAPSLIFTYMKKENKKFLPPFSPLRQLEEWFPTLDKLDKHFEPSFCKFWTIWTFQSNIFGSNKQYYEKNPKTSGFGDFTSYVTIFELRNPVFHQYQISFF